MAAIYGSVEELIGRTPLLELHSVARACGAQARLVAKLEGQNPAGSVKDRVARSMIADAEERGLLTPDCVVIEPTSGYTGIGLAAVCASRGIRLIIVMPSTMSAERRALIGAYGAQLVLTDGKLGMAGAIARAEELQREIPHSFIAGQFYNPANPRAHLESTGPEIFADTDGAVDIFLAGVGSGGTISGTGAYLKQQKPSVRVVAVEPASSAVLSGEPAGSHKIQGIGAGFVPENYNPAVVDEVVAVTDEDAFAAARLLGEKQGILCGISSGAVLSAGMELAKKRENRDKTIVMLFADTGERYLSAGLFPAQETGEPL